MKNSQMNLTKKAFFITALTGVYLLWMGVTSSVSQEIVKDSRLERALQEARRVSDDLGEGVRRLLLKEIERGGFVGAVRVCSESAQEITGQFNLGTGHSVRRVSLKYRNPKNVPDEYERRKLEEFDLLNRQKKLEKEYVEGVTEEGRQYLRYMRPLLIAPLCLTCHGPEENIPQEVKAILSEKYPDDRATGFLGGDVRGAISARIALP
jgi:hypothetical protein